MRGFAVARGAGALRVEAQVVRPGKDIAVVFGGGDAPHVGAVAVAFPRPSLRRDGSMSASASVICGLGHKEDEAAREAALRLASRLQVTAVVSVGIHIEQPRPEDLRVIMDNFVAVLEEVLRRLEMEEE